jgi:ribulose-5-phosphate 4-epimerase/fuculose-1-phosphate aldolase
MIGQSMAATPMSDVEALRAENVSMRNALTNATSIINEMDTQPMPPIVGDGFVVPAHVVSDFVRIGRQLQRDGLCHATVGSISTLSLDEPNLVHITKEGSPLGQLDERHVASGRLGEMAPMDVGSAWKTHTILLAVTSLEHNGNAACAHLPAPYTTAMSLEQDLFVLRPSDLAGKQRFESVVIVDSDDVSEDDFLRQLSEGLAQSKCKAIVVRGGGVYAVGANFNEAWDNAAAIEHSMKILFLTRLADIE